MRENEIQQKKYLLCTTDWFAHLQISELFIAHEKVYKTGTRDLGNCDGVIFQIYQSFDKYASYAYCLKCTF